MILYPDLFFLVDGSYVKTTYKSIGSGTIDYSIIGSKLFINCSDGVGTGGYTGPSIYFYLPIRGQYYMNYNNIYTFNVSYGETSNGLTFDYSPSSSLIVQYSGVYPPGYLLFYSLQHRLYGVSSSAWIDFSGYFVVIPSESIDSSIYAPSTRINNTTFNLISGYDVYQNVSIVNEGDNTFYNPADNTTYEFNNWTYDYGLRMYSGEIDLGGVTVPVTVEFGLDNLEINIGDDVYTYNYVVEETTVVTPTPVPTVEPTPVVTATPEITVSPVETENPRPYNNYTISISDGDNTYYDVVLVDEDNRTFYNPVTNQYYEFHDYIYDSTNNTYVGTVLDGELTIPVSVHFVVDGVDLTFNNNSYSFEYVASPTPAPSLVPVSPSPIPSDYDTDDTPFWLWLQEWLNNFKTWLDAKLDALSGNGSETVIDNSYTDNSQDITNIYDYSITYENLDGEEEEISAFKFINKFRWIKSVFNIGKSLVSVVSSDAAAAYDLDIAGLDAASAVEEGPQLDGIDTSSLRSTALRSGSAPSIPINLASANSHYGFDYGGQVEMLDLSWYTPYKSTVDGIVSGFLWVFFCWKLFQKLPGIIGGSSMDSSKLEDIENGERKKRK